MLRFLRIIGIIIFACLIGFFANSLWKMYETGELLEQYNNAPKMNLILLGVSVVALSGLGFFEMSLFRHLGRRRGYGKSRLDDETENKEARRDSSSIYATPPASNDWKGHRTRSRGGRHKPRPRSPQKEEGEPGMIWMRLLQIICVALSLTYLTLLSLNLMEEHEGAWGAIFIPVAFGTLFILSLVANVGIFGKKTSGLVFGYTLAVCNLLVFPYGTAAGLILMMGLVGASPVFEVSASADRHNRSRKK